MKFVLIVFNLFYIEENDLYLSLGDVCFELKSVLVVVENGLVDICYISMYVLYFLFDGGWFLFEYGYD